MRRLKTSNHPSLVTSFELAHTCLRHFFPPLYNKIRRRILTLIQLDSREIEVLDVGGRKSPYTIGVPAWITITDLPRKTALQRELNLGYTPEIADQIMASRSNVREVIFDDMTASFMPDGYFDGAIAVEVLEHVEEDRMFISEIYRILKPGGWFLMSTPNGDYIKNTNPDHKRHYTRKQLEDLLRGYFPSVDLEYAVKGSRFRRAGQRPWSVRKPWQTTKSMFGHVINALESRSSKWSEQPQGTHHLIAIARKD